MESFARRGIRTTVAVAGLAALGVGLAAPTAFALPSVPEVSGVGNTRTTPSAGTPSNVGAAGSAFDALPERFQFAPPVAPSTSQSASQSASRSTEAADDESTESETTPSTDSTQSDPTDTEATEEDPEAAPVATPSEGLLPAIPGSPVAAQASPQVSGVDPSSALQSLDSGSMF